MQKIKQPFLVGFEESQVITTALRKKGIEAFSPSPIQNLTKKAPFFGVKKTLLENNSVALQYQRFSEGANLHYITQLCYLYCIK